jgi:hypothetical protein
MKRRMLLLFIAECLALFSGFMNFFLRVKGVEPVHWLLAIVPSFFSFKLGAASVFVIIAFAFLLFRKGNIAKLTEFSLGALPVLLFLPGLLIPLSFFSILFFIAIVSWSVWRIFNRCGWMIPEGEKYAKLCCILTVAASVAGFSWGVWMQFDAWRRLKLVFSDWSVYVQAYQTLGSCLFSQPLKFFNVGGHFNLLPNLIGAFVFEFSPEPSTIFYLNSFVIYSTVPCVWFVLRSLKIAPFHAMLFSLSLLYHFTLANLNSCVFYGYHPNIYFLPLFLLCFGFFVRKNYKTAVSFLLLTLLVQETFAVFWFGTGLMLAICERGKKQKAGIILMLLMIAWFLLVSRVFMRWADTENIKEYQQMFHYSNLGSTIPEILLSPICKPAVFFKELFGIENFYFAGMLLLGSCASLFAARYFIVLAPVFLGVALLNGAVLSNIAMQYQVEFFAMLTAASGVGLAACRKISLHKESALLAAAVTGAVLCGCFAGRLPWGFYSYADSVKSFPDCRENIRRFKEFIPACKTLQTTLKYQAHFIGRNKLLDVSSKEILPEAEYILIPGKDIFISDADLQALIRLLARSGKYKVLVVDKTPGAEALLLTRK